MIFINWHVLFIFELVLYCIYFRNLTIAKIIIYFYLWAKLRIFKFRWRYRSAAAIGSEIIFLPLYVYCISSTADKSRGY